MPNNPATIEYTQYGTLGQNKFRRVAASCSQNSYGPYLSILHSGILKACRALVHYERVFEKQCFGGVATQAAMASSCGCY